MVGGTGVFVGLGVFVGGTGVLVGAGLHVPPEQLILEHPYIQEILQYRVSLQHEPCHQLHVPVHGHSLLIAHPNTRHVPVLPHTTAFAGFVTEGKIKREAMRIINKTITRFMLLLQYHRGRGEARRKREKLYYYCPTVTNPGSSLPSMSVFNSASIAGSRTLL